MGQGGLLRWTDETLVGIDDLYILKMYLRCYDHRRVLILSVGDTRAV